MREARSCVVDDAPWLEMRLNRALIAFVHPSLDREVAFRLGALRLSRCLVEVPGRCEACDTLPPDALRTLATWESNLRSAAFAAAVRRAATSSPQQHCRNDNNTEQRKVLDARNLAALKQTTLAAASVIRSRFSLDGRDVTADDSGSKALVVSHDGKPLMYVLAAEKDLQPGFEQRWRAPLAKALDRFLGGPGVLQESAALLTELFTVNDKARMSEVLDSYEIPSHQPDHRLGADHVLVALEAHPRYSDRMEAPTAIDRGGSSLKDGWSLDTGDEWRGGSTPEETNGD